MSRYTYTGKHRNRAIQRQIINGPAMREPATVIAEPPPYVPPPAITNPELPEIQPQFSVKERLRVCRVERHGDQDRYVLIAEVPNFVEGERIANSQKWQTRVIKFGEPRATRSNWQPVKPEPEPEPEEEPRDDAYERAERSQAWEAKGGGGL